MAEVLPVTGSCGLIGRQFVRLWLEHFPDDPVVVYDRLTYAGRRENLAGVWNRPALHLVVGDIADGALVRQTYREYGVTAVVHPVAESHVDQFVGRPLGFTHTNVVGTHVLLKAAREFGLRFHLVPTAEVYGPVPHGKRRAAPTRSARRRPTTSRSPATRPTGWG